MKDKKSFHPDLQSKIHKMSKVSYYKVYNNEVADNNEQENDFPILAFEKYLHIMHKLLVYNQENTLL